MSTPVDRGVLRLKNVELNTDNLVLIAKKNSKSYRGGRDVALAPRDAVVEQVEVTESPFAVLENEDPHEKETGPHAVEAHTPALTGKGVLENEDHMKKKRDLVEAHTPVLTAAVAAGASSET